MFHKYDHFTDDEFKCPCCGMDGMMDSFVTRLHNARVMAGVPFRINSGYRCDKHNEEVGGSPTSSHMLGHAADIRCDDSKMRDQIVRALIGAGFHRIGIANNFIHVDDDASKPQGRIWVYPA